MLRELTVEENIRHSAFMRLPSEMSRKVKEERVYQVMESLDLIRIRNSVIGDEITRGISGGTFQLQHERHHRLMKHCAHVCLTSFRSLSFVRIPL